MEYYKNLSLENIVYVCKFDLVLKTEEWSDIPNYEGNYQVSDRGRIKSLKCHKEMILKQSCNKHGYLFLNLFKLNSPNYKTVHQLVAIAFLNHIPCGYKLAVNHKNFIKTDNRKLNLEIVTFRENNNKKHIPSISEYTGVFLNKKTNKWTSKIGVKSRSIFLGTFNTELEASLYFENAVSAIKNGTKIEFKKHIPTSLHKGISWCNTHFRWIVQITAEGKRIKVGSYRSEIDAIMALEKIKNKLTIKIE